MIMFDMTTKASVDEKDIAKVLHQASPESFRLVFVELSSLLHKESLQDRDAPAQWFDARAKLLAESSRGFSVATAREVLDTLLEETKRHRIIKEYEETQKESK